jgi:hypothetical protein
MKVYDPVPAEQYEFVQPVPPDDWESIRLRFDAHVAGMDWRPRPLKLIQEDEGKKQERGDWLYLDSHIPVLRATAALAIKHVLDPGDQLLPMTCGREQLYLLKPKWTIDALDEAASDIWRFDNGRIIAVHKHVFKEEAFDLLRPAHQSLYLLRHRSLRRCLEQGRPHRPRPQAPLGESLVISGGD